MASRRLVVVPFELVRPLLEPTIEETPLLKPKQILRQQLVPKTKVALYSSALNRQLGIKFPDTAGEVSVPIEQQNQTGDTQTTINTEESRTATINESPRQPSPEPPLESTPVNTRRRPPPRKGLSPRAILQRRLREQLNQFVTTENRVNDLNGEVIAGSDATKLIDYVTDPDTSRRAPRGIKAFITLIRALDIGQTLIINPTARKAFLKKNRPAAAARIDWDDLGYD